MDINLLIPATPAIQQLCVRSVLQGSLLFHLELSFWLFARLVVFCFPKKKHVCAVRVSFRACYYHVVDVWLKHHEKSVQLFSKNKIAILLVKIRKKTVIGSDTIPYIDMYYFIKCLINISNFICAERENLIFFKTDKTTRQYFFFCEKLIVMYGVL